MLNHVLHNKEGLRVAVIVNDMSEVNVDAELVKSEKHPFAYRGEVSGNEQWLYLLYPKRGFNVRSRAFGQGKQV